MRIRKVVGGGLFLAMILMAMSGSASAQSLTEGQIAVIQPKPVLIENRLEILPRFAVTFNDPLISQFSVGGSLYYHISEDYNIGATFEWFDFSNEFGGTTDVYNELIRSGSVIPEVAPITYSASLDFGWVPIRGKFALFNSAITYYNIYTILGAGVIDSVADPNPALSLGIGQRIFIGDWFGITLEIRDRMYIEPLPSGDAFTNILSVSLGLNFFVPPQFRLEGQDDRILDWE